MVEHLRISHLGHRGDGVVEGMSEPVYVPYTLPGEAVEAEAVHGHPDRRTLLRIAQASPERIAPICPHFGTCGGCAVQHWEMQHYRAWKRDLVVSALAQARIEAPVDALVDAHGDGRRRAVLHARRGTHDVLEVGFAAPRAHHIVAIDRCPVLAPPLAHVVETAWAIAEALRARRKPLDIHVTAADQGVDIDVRGSGPLSPGESAALAAVAGKHRLSRLTRHGEIVAQQSVPTVRMGRATVPLPPGAFLQATTAGEAELARLVTSHASGARTVADLFSGIGPFALRIAEQARVIAADSDADAIASLQRAVAATSGLKPIDAGVRDLFRRPFTAKELARVDAVVFDPPRQGAEAQARELAGSRVPRVIAVSCNPASFARDARLLLDGGYRLAGVTPVDQFRYAAHVELVARFER